jgi:hypothetical protein
MGAHAQTERPTVWWRLWHAIHGAQSGTSQHEVDRALARLEVLEAAARELGALEDVEKQRADVVQRGPR